MPTEPDRIGLAVCRLGLNAGSGRIQHPVQLGIAIRGALFAELVLDGRLRGSRVPTVAGPSDTGNKLADSVHRAVSSRRPTPWKRWYSHVRADLEAATAALVSGGVWRDEGSGRFIDTDPELANGQAAGIAELLRLSVPPAEDEDAVVALLVGGAGPLGGRPRPRAR